MTKCKLQITTVREISLFCYAFLIFLNIFYIDRYRNIGFLNHQIFVSVSALKILYRSGSSMLCVYGVCRVCMVCVYGVCRVCMVYVYGVCRVCMVCVCVCVEDQ